MKRLILAGVAAATVLLLVDAASAQNQFRVGGGANFRRSVPGRVRFSNNGALPIRPGFGGIGGIGRGGFGPIFAGGGVAVAPNYNGFFGDGGFTNLYNQGFIPVPPYFSLHPPVYYSVPVPRTYGYSPFAYPGNTPTPEVTFPMFEPEEIINPHVEPLPEQPAEETSQKTAFAPQVINNPYVDSHDVGPIGNLVSTPQEESPR